MKSIRLTCYENGNAHLDAKEFYFSKENLSVNLTVYFPPMDGYIKRLEWYVNDTQKGYITGNTDDSMVVNLTYQQLLEGRTSFQCIATNGEIVIKYKPVMIEVRYSLNVLQNDATVTPSIAEILQHQIDQAVARIVDLENRTLEDFPFGREE